jgi:hypothetical protein
MTAQTQKLHHPLARFCSGFFRSGPRTSGMRNLGTRSITVSDLALLPRKSQLLIAHFLDQKMRTMTILDSDTDIQSLLSIRLVRTLPRTQIGVTNLEFTRDAWAQLQRIRTKFLSDQILTELELYRKHKSAEYPWIW